MQVNKDDFMELMCNVFHQFLAGTKINSFPGNLPISLQRSHLFKLAFGYVIGLKADGARSFIFIAQGHIFQIQRNMQITFIGLTSTKDLYLFDGEVIESLDLILLFDTIIFMGKNVIRVDITKRNEMARQFLSSFGIIIENNNSFWEKKRLPSNFETKVLFVNGSRGWKLQSKPLFSYYHLKEVWEKRFTLPYSVDGIIFSRKWNAYQPFRQDPMSLIKWKELQEITIDFLLLVYDNGDDKEMKRLCDTTSKLSMYQEKNGNVLLSTTALTDARPIYFSFATFNHQIVYEYANVIVECAWDKNDNNWKFVKVRHDKTTPNTLPTVIETLKNIADPIDIKDFLL